jgi:SAM-dependent methyltransferase
MGPGVSGARAQTRRPPGKNAFWTFNWLARHKIIRSLERVREHASGELLDVGCGARPFARVFDGRVTRYWGTDLAGSRDLAGVPPDFFSRGEALPVGDARMDTVLGLSMLTYFTEPDRMLEEAYRVLRPGGVLIMEFTQMAAVLESGYDYYRFTRHGAEVMLRRAGFDLVEAVPLGGLWSRAGLHLIGRLNRINRGPWRVLTELPVRTAYIVIQLGAEALDHLLPTPAERLAHIMVARRPKNTPTT